MKLLVFRSADDKDLPVIAGKLDKLRTFLNIDSVECRLPDEVPDCEAGDVVYVASFCADLKLLLRGITNLVKTTTARKCCLLEDLVAFERPYIFSTRENQFFRNYMRLGDVCQVEMQVMSSNALRNSFGEDDTRICQLPEISGSLHYWQEVKDKVNFHEMMNQGNAVPRLVSIQSIADPELGRPLYRHPNDEEPPNVEMVPIVREILQIVEAHTHVRGINHALIQWYRHGRDNIAAHSDKTLDIDLNTPIINVSLGASRVMTIQNKGDKNFLEKIPLQNGECVVFGLGTNRFWHHEVAKDVTMKEHPDFGTERISFTFRRIATFVNGDGVIVGQGSPYKNNEQIAARREDSEVVEMLQNQTRSDLIHAFSKENRQAEEFDWHSAYGKGFVIR